MLGKIFIPPKWFIICLALENLGSGLCALLAFIPFNGSDDALLRTAERLIAKSCLCLFIRIPAPFSHILEAPPDKFGLLGSQGEDFIHPAHESDGEPQESQGNRKNLRLVFFYLTFVPSRDPPLASKVPKLDRITVGDEESLTIYSFISIIALATHERFYCKDMSGCSTVSINPRMRCVVRAKLDASCSSISHR